MFFHKNAFRVFPQAVVGTIPSRTALAAAQRLNPKAVDFLEIRVDAFAKKADCALLEKSIPHLKSPLIITVRHPLEGGSNRLGIAQRREFFGRFLPYASLIDVELRSAEPLSKMMDEAQSSGVSVILSHHDFRQTPSLSSLQHLLQKAQRIGCSIFKLATTVRHERELAALYGFLTTGHSPNGPALSVMGMGRLGKISRLLLGSAGSVLNYGYLDKAQVPGQWPAVTLKERLQELIK